MRKALILMAFLAIFSICIPASSAAEHFLNPDFGFRIDIPAEMERVDAGNSLVGLALRARGLALKYPTFNIIGDSRRFEPSKFTIAQVGEEILNDYRLVGLLGVKLIRSDVIDLPSGRRVTVDLEYNYGGDHLCAEVTHVPGKARSFFLTFINYCDRFESTREAAKGLRESFEALSPAPKSESQGIPLFPGLLLVILLISLTLLFLRWRNLRPNI